MWMLFYEFFVFRACKKFQQIEQGDLDDSDVDRKYQPSGSESEEDEEISGDEAVEDEDDGRTEDSTEAEPREIRPKIVRRKLAFVPSRKFPRLYDMWKESLKILGYAKCEIKLCDFIGYSFREINDHHKSCSSKYKLALRLNCVIQGCKHQCYDQKSLLRHYLRTHGKTEAEAMSLSKEKKISFLEHQRRKWEPLQAEIDALKLFD